MQNRLGQLFKIRALSFTLEETMSNFLTSLRMLRYFFLLTPLCIGIGLHTYLATKKKPAIKIGLLHALTGPVAIKTEQSILSMELYTIEQLNKAGGLLGHLIEPVIKDFQGDPKLAASMAESLIKHDRVDFIFGGAASDGRRQISQIATKHNKFYFCSINHEGLDISPNTIFCNHTANQHLMVAMHWGKKNLGDRIFLIGSDTPYSRINHQLANAYAESLNKKLVGESFILSKNNNFKETMAAIEATKPTLIISTSFGNANIPLIKALYENKITIPIIWLHFSFSHLPHLDKKMLKKHYFINSYFENIENPINKSFITSLRETLGYSQAVGNQEEAAYTALQLWAEAIKESGSLKIDSIKKALSNNLCIAAPDGPVFLDPEKLYAWKNSYIATFDNHEHLKIVWQSQKPINPDPFPEFRTKAEWADLVITATKQSKDVQ